MGMGGECVGPCSSAGSLTACRFHTGAEQGWTRGMFSSLRVTSTLKTADALGGVTVDAAWLDAARLFAGQKVRRMSNGMTQTGCSWRFTARTARPCVRVQTAAHCAIVGTLRTVLAP